MDIHTQVQVAASADNAWQVVGEAFGTVGDFTTAISASSLAGELGVGATRVCHTHNAGLFPKIVVEEVLTEFDRTNQRYTYVVNKGLPAMFEHAQNAWSIEPVDAATCVIHSHARLTLAFWFRPVEWLIKRMIQHDMKKYFEEIAYFVEHHQIHPRKAKQLAGAS